MHRNTLTNRLSRIAAITGQQVDTAAGRGLIWLARPHREVGAATRRAPTSDQAAAAGPLATRPRPAAASGRFRRASSSGLTPGERSRSVATWKIGQRSP